MSCKLCLKHKKLIKAHIIPKSFYGSMRKGKTPPRLISDASKFRAKRAPTGVYDKTIVCEECERRFQSWDDYAASSLLPSPTGVDYIYDELGNELAYKVTNIDYKRLKLFFVSVLWRISASSQLFFSQVKLGPHEAKLRHLILAEDPGDEDTYSVVLSRFVEPIAKHRGNGTIT